MVRWSGGVRGRNYYVIDLVIRLGEGGDWVGFVGGL